MLNKNRKGKILQDHPSKRKLETIIHQWDREKLEKYALSLSVDMVRARTEHQKLTELVDGLTLIEKIGHHLSSTLDVDEVLKLLLRRVSESLDVTDSSILFVEEPSGDLVFQTSLGSLSEELKPFRIPKGQGIAGEVALTGMPIRIDDAQNDTRHFKMIDQDTGFQTRSILCVPLNSREKTIGVIEVFNKKTGSFTEQDQILLSSIATYAAIAIENAQLHQSVLQEKDRVIKAQEEVSKQLQRDLHDGPTQLVAALEMSIDFCQKALQHQNTDLVETELENMARITKKATHQMRTLLFELRPLVLETQGLVYALQSLVERYQLDARSNIQLKITADTPDNQISRMDGRVESALFSIVQEAVNNALKHANAQTILIKLDQFEHILTVSVIDNGVGFDLNRLNQNYEAQGSYGMLNLQERTEIAGGHLTIKSTIGKGTEIHVTLPIVPVGK